MKKLDVFDIILCAIVFCELKMLISSWYSVFTLMLLCKVTMQQETCVKSVSNSEVYDFKRLAANSWNVSITNEDLEILSFSLCNITHDSICGNVSFCVIKDHIAFSSHHSQFEVANGTVILTGELNGNISSQTIKVEVIFRCSNEDENPQYFKEEDKEIIRLLWKTVAACPIRNSKAFENCLFSNNGLLHPINLQSARKMNYYETRDPEGNSYFLNICGTEVRGMVCGNLSNVAACKKDANNSITVLAEASKQHAIKVEDGLVLELRNKSRSHVKIEIICNPSMDPKVSRGFLNFKTVLGDKSKDVHKFVYVFELETPLACVLEPVDCVVTDKQRQLKYNLSSLSSEVHINSSNGIQYKLSICKPLENTFPYGAFAHLCNGANCVNSGTLFGGPQLVHKKLVLSSLGGAKCNETFRYRTEVEFICSKTEQDPTFEKAADCVNKFLWHSKAACPSIYAVGNNCELYDEFYSHSFDFKPLYKHGDYKIITNDGLFELNICGALSKRCNGSKNVGVCFIDTTGHEHAIGNTALRPLNENGRLGFVLEGRCSENRLSTVHIIFMCEHSTTLEKSQPIYLTKDDCTFYFGWPTDITCGKFKEYNCQYSDGGGNKYDLSSLSYSYSNTIVLSGSKKFFINICRSIVIGHDVRCPFNTGICLENIAEVNFDKKFIALGEPSDLQYNKEKNVFYIEYKNAPVCVGNDDEFHSLITFVCDRNATGETVPELIQETPCYYEFQWKTKLVCSKEEMSAVEIHNCKIYDSFSDSQFDLTSLTNKRHSVVTSSGDTLHLAVCGSLNETSKPSIGVCQEIDKGCENLGVGNADLYFHEGTLVLNYTGGGNCTGNLRKYTTIEFLCDAEDSGPRVKNFSSCSLVITWYTSLVCGVPCVTEGSGKRVNISLLKDNERNYKTKFDGVDYFINVCRPLVPIQGLNCKHGSAVCRAVEKAKNKWTDVMDLGIPRLQPVLIDREFVLKYSSDLHCLHSTSQNVSSSLKFICDPKAGKGNPVLHNFVLDCSYEFEWKTNVVCDDNEIKLEHTSWKFFTSNEKDLFVDLNSVCSDKMYKVQNFMISMCNNGSVSEVYKMENNKQILFGKSTSIVFSYSENTTKIFIIGEGCKHQSTERYSAVLNLLCSMRESQLSVLKESECSVEFLWETNAGCLQTESDKKEIAASHISIAGLIVGILLIIFTCICVVCFRTPANRNWCRRKINLLFNKTHRSEYGYTLTQWDD